MGGIRILNIAFLGITAASWSVSQDILQKLSFFSKKSCKNITTEQYIPIIIMYYEYISVFESFKFINSHHDYRNI